MNNLPTSPINLSLDFSALFLLAFYLLLVTFIIHTTIVVYHWNTYGTGGRWQTIGVLTHLVVGTGLFLGMFLLLP
jgi:hypothetical protein